MTKRRRITAILLTVLFVVAVLLSLDFITQNHEHDCTGADCPVCAVLHLAEEVSGGAKKATAVGSLFAFCVVALFAVKVKKQHLITAVTPVSLSDILTI